MAKKPTPKPKPVAKKAAPKPVAKKPAPKPVAKKVVAKKPAPKPVAKKPIAAKVARAAAAKKPAPKPAPKISPAKAALLAQVAKKATAPKPIESEPVSQASKSTSQAQLALAAPVPPPAAGAPTPGPSSAPVSAPAPTSGGAGTGVLMSLSAPPAPSEGPKISGPSHILPDAPSEITAQDLNTLWEGLAKSFDENSNRISDSSVAGMIGKSLSDWQDFFYSTDEWPADEVLRWSEIYNKTRDTYEAAAKPSRKADDDGTVFNVTGKLSKNKKLIIAGAAAGVGLLGYMATKKKRRR